MASVRRLLLALLLAGCATRAPTPPPRSVTAAPPAPPGKARVDLATRQSTHFLGENVLLDFCVVDTSRAPITIDVGGDYEGAWRPQRFKLEVRDAASNLVPDPHPGALTFGGRSYAPTIEPGKRWCDSLQLMAYARIDAPGTYTITATHDLGWKNEKPPVGTTKVTLVMPSAAEAEAVVAAMAALPDEPNAAAGQPSPSFADFTSFRYDVYTAPLAKLAAADPRAVVGLGNIPTEAATRALVSLLSNASPNVASQAAGQLGKRLPDRLGDRSSFTLIDADERRSLQRAWVPSLADDVRAAARKLLASSTLREVLDGGSLLEGVGTPADAPDLVKGLDAAIARTRTDASWRGACGNLLRVAEVLVDQKLAAPAKPKSAGEIAVWLVALAGGAQPPGWEAELGRAMRHPIAYVRQMALEHVARGGLPASLVSAVAADLGDRDVDVVVAAAALAQREHVVALAPLVVRAMPNVTDVRLSTLSNAAFALGAGTDRARMLVSMLRDAGAFRQAFPLLEGLLDRRGSSSTGEPDDAEREALSARWSTFVAQHRAEIQAGTAVPLSDPSVTADLLPRGWKLRRADGTAWP